VRGAVSDDRPYRDSLIFRLRVDKIALLRCAGDPNYLLESAAQIALIVSSWLKPFGYFGVWVLAKYQLNFAPDLGFTGPFVNMRPPGISRNLRQG
jgi:hypothetical protein